MKYDTEWMIANLRDMEQLCKANSMHQTAQKILDAINCAQTEKEIIFHLRCPDMASIN